VNFVSWAFVALFAIVLAARLTIGRRKIEPAYVLLLIVASATFYAWHIPVYIGILFLSAAIDYWAALWLARLDPAATSRRRAVLALARHQPVRWPSSRCHPFSTWRATCSTGGASPAARAGAGPAHGHQLLHVPVDVTYRRTRRAGAHPPFWPSSCSSASSQLVAGYRARVRVPAADAAPAAGCRRVFYEGAWLIISGSS
jgi:hypothetical protein